MFTSCSQEGQSKKQVAEATEAKKASLANDSRNIGPAKSQQQYTIEENIFRINSENDPIYGYWVGVFGKNKINIAIALINGDSIYGHSVCAGNFRPIKGTMNSVGEGLYSITMKEPGDDKYDGEFNFEIDITKKELKGSWSSYKKTVSNTTYTLNKRQFEYDRNAGNHPEGSTDWLEPFDVENLLPEEIEIIRNEIYARHGYSFTNLKIRRIFDAKDWYIPMSIDIRDQLTEVEAHNIDMLYNYEEYYNDFGR